MVQITDTNDISTDTPSGQAVPWYMLPQTSALGLNFDNPCAVRSHAAGMRMITMISAMMLKVEPALLTRAIQRVGKDAMTLWIIMRQTVRRNVCSICQRVIVTGH